MAEQSDIEILNRVLGGKTEKNYQARPASTLAPLTPDTAHDDIFQALRAVKVDSIKGVIEDIEALIGKRDELSEQIYKKIDKLLNMLNNVELQMNATSVDDAALKREVLQLKSKQVDLETLRIREQVENWKDVAQLKHELRERVKEFKEKEGRLDMLDKILGE